MARTTGSATGWKVEGNHIYPIGDLREHVPVDCWCRPTDDEGVIVHHTLDRRELYEQGLLKLS